MTRDDEMVGWCGTGQVGGGPRGAGGVLEGHLVLYSMYSTLCTLLLRTQRPERFNTPLYRVLRLPSSYVRSAAYLGSFGLIRAPM